MLRSTDYCKEYKNGNITIRFDKDAIQEMKKDEILFLSDALYWLDCYFIGETFCISNFETGHSIYNYYSDLLYIFQWREMENLMQGKTVRLYGYKPSKDDREWIDQEMGN